MDKSAQASHETIGAFLQEVKPGTKQAEAQSEAGSIGGPTSHPVKDVDDRLEDADEGARSAENTTDVKSKDTGQGEASVDATPEATAKVGMAEGTAAEDQNQIGTNKQPTGDDSSVETDSTKPGKEDGGYEAASTHPARTDNDDLDGHKFAAALEEMPLEKLGAVMQDLGNDLCAVVTTELSKQGNARPAAAAAAAVAQPSQAQAPKTAADRPQVPAALEQQLGYEMAGLVTGQFDKEAADTLVDATLTDIVKEASASAERVADYLDARTVSQQRKTAMEGDEADLGQAGNDDGGGDGPAVADEGAALGGGGDELAAALGGEAGGAPEAGLPPEAGAPPEGGGQDEEQMLLAVLEQLGVSPEEFMAAMQQEAAGGGGGGMGGMGGEGGMGGGEAAMAMGGMGGEGAGGPPPGPEAMGGMGGMAGPAGAGAPPVPGMEVAASDRHANLRNHLHSVMRKTAAAPMQGTTVQKAAAISSYVSEVVNRSRAQKAAAAAKA